MKKQNRFSLIFAIIAFFTLALTGCSNNNAAPKRQTQIRFQLITL
ncbi:hypothetical protein IMAU30002_00321 [Lactobacillus helveticus]|nr:hypothetical protein [Lactobacillus helveticus]